MFINENPVRLAKKIAKSIRDIRATKASVQKAKRRFLERCKARRKLRKSKGPEYVVENLVRPRLGRFLVTKYAIPRQHVPFWLASSHFHSGNDAYSAEWWQLFKARYRKADTKDRGGSLRRGDLFVGTLAGQIVSVELKHLPAGKSLDIPACVKQVKQYLKPGNRGRGHDATVLVVYQERPGRLRPLELEAQLAAKLRTNKAFAVVIEGPQVSLKARKAR
jgi:hypothetical protein